MNMRMNLTGLADLANAQLANKGRPLDLRLEDIIPDPDNPRRADDEESPAAIEAQEQLDGDVAERGVKTPISVRPHPTLPGKYIINYGHKRYKSACRNKLATVPGFVDERFDSYDQVNENELRTGLSARALALFIKGRLDAGDTKGQIAQRMRKRNQTFITEHLALIDAPECVNDAYSAGVTSARTLYDLRQAWQEFPAAIEAWCRGVSHINREGIREAIAKFRHDEAGASIEQGACTARPQETAFRHDEKMVLATPELSVDQHFERHDIAEPEEAEANKSGAASRVASDRQKTREVDSMQSVSTVAVQAPSIDGTIVYFEGKLARIAPDVVVPIVLDGGGSVLNVPLSGLVFK